VSTSPDRSARPLVWLPFDPADLEAEIPSGLEMVQVDLGRKPDPDGYDRVRFFVPNYEGGFDMAETLGRMTSLEVVQTQTAGVDSVAPVLPDGVTLCNARGVHDASTAELAVGLLLATLRGFPGFVRAQDESRWAYEFRRSLADSTVLIVGAGSIATALLRRLLPFEVDVVRVGTRFREDDDGVVHGSDELPDLLPGADAVVLLVPLTDSTRQLVDAKFLAAMKDGAVLVNVARGPIVDTDALLAETESGRLLAALDVTDPEPLPAGHPLWRSPGVLISPHVGGATSAMLPRVHALLREQLTRFATGAPLTNVVAGPGA
jgi:phosphoglycerate dehydrogenase-like enzyme